MKERFEIKDKHVQRYISGLWSAKDLLEKKFKSGRRSREQTDRLQK